MEGVGGKGKAGEESEEKYTGRTTRREHSGGSTVEGVLWREHCGGGTVEGEVQISSWGRGEWKCPSESVILAQEGGARVLVGC